MARKLTMNGNEGLFFSLDVGNGECKGISTAAKTLVTFEPVHAPLSKKRTTAEDDKPGFSLRLKDGSQFVYGVEDVFAHGQRENIRRLNSSERYTSPEYFNMVELLLLHLFAGYRGQSEYIKPYGALCIPVEQYNDQKVVDEIKKTLIGKHQIIDIDGCELRIQIDEARLSILPESSGAIAHWAFDPQTLKRRADTSGSTLVIDPGFETTDCTLYEGLRYMRDRAFTFSRTGMGNVTRAVTDYVKTVIRNADVSRVDVAMRGIAGVRSGSPKSIEPTPGKVVDIAPAYDVAVANLAAKIADDVRTHYPEDVTRVVLAGGGAYHLCNALEDHLPFPVEAAPQPEYANVYGAMTGLKIKAEAGR